MLMAGKKIGTLLVRNQEYPPGVNIIPMGSRTGKPFCTTNLIVFAPGNNHVECESSPFVAQGDAMIVDPGCRSEFNEELAEIVAALPRKLIVFVTHHHRDHVDAILQLSIVKIQKHALYFSEVLSRTF